MKTYLVKLAVVSLFVLALVPGAGASFGGYRELSCIMHVHSVYSGMKTSKTISDIVKEARSKGIDVVITSDKDILKWEYGIRPLSNLIKVSYSFPSVLSAGPQKYFNAVSAVQKQFPEMIVIPGVESAPFYCWKGNPFNGTLEMCGWHKHVLVFGMDKAEDYANLPVVSNRNAGSFNILLLWPALLIVIAFMLKIKQAVRITLVIASVVFLVNNYPFRYFEFNVYSGDQGEKPYQKLIDYVNSKGGLIFWAHPEAINNEAPRKIGQVSISTARYSKSIIDTTDYTGFAIFTEGYRETGRPGGYWDTALNEYVQGKRARPVWACGEVDYGENSLSMEQAQNILLVKERSKPAVLEALRKGNFFVYQQDTKWGLRLDEFYVSSGEKTAICGQEIERGGPIHIHMSVNATDSVPHRVKASVIRNGSVVKVFEAETPVELIYNDQDAPAGKCFYRVYIEGGFQVIATNPVFVKSM